MRRTLLTASVLLLAAGSAASARVTQPAPSSGATFIVTGHGWGHGVGMSQYGAYGFAQKGWTYSRIVPHYYVGTEIGAAPVSRVRVLLASGTKSLKIGSAGDFKVRDGTGVLHTAVAGTYTLTPTLRLRVDGGATARVLPGPLLFQPAGTPLALKRRYRGSIQVDVVNGSLRAVNMVNLEQYLYGVVPSEMPYTWLPEALKAQAVAARSYALATRKTGAFDLYSDTRSQVYLGIDHEKPATNAAVDATAGQVVLYEGEVAKTFFFSTSGGRTASAEDVWGEAVPYLVSVPDPYDSISPHHDWGPFPYTGTKLAKVLKMPGSVVDLEPELNSSGRIKALTAVGTKSTLSVKGTDLRKRLGLRSTWFSVGVLSLSAPPVVIYGNRARLTGLARGLTQVALQQQQGAEWRPLATVKPLQDGALSVVVKPTVTTRYRVTSGKAVAPSVRLPVASLVRFYPTRAQTQLRGYVRPGTTLAGATVAIQQQQGMGWATVARTTVDAEGNFLAKLQLTTGVYRARVSSGRGFVAGTSPVLQVSTQ